MSDKLVIEKSFRKRKTTITLSKDNHLLIEIWRGYETAKMFYNQKESKLIADYININLHKITEVK